MKHILLIIIFFTAFNAQVAYATEYPKELAPSKGFMEAFTKEAKLTKEKQAVIKEYMQVTGATKLGTQMTDQFVKLFLPSILKIRTNIPPSTHKLIEEEIRLFFHEELTVKDSLYPLLYPLYHKYFSLKDLHGLIRFYKTPLGKKLVRVSPPLVQESMLVGSEWGKSLVNPMMQRITKRLKKEGIEVQ